MNRRGFTLVEIMVVTMLLVLMAAIAVPSYIRSRTRAQTEACIENLRQIEGAKDRYAIEMGKVNGDTVDSTDIVPFFLKKLQGCPASGQYEFNPIGFAPTCNISGHELY